MRRFLRTSAEVSLTFRLECLASLAFLYLGRSLQKIAVAHVSYVNENQTPHIHTYIHIQTLINVRLFFAIRWRKKKVENILFYNALLAGLMIDLSDSSAKRQAFYRATRYCVYLPLHELSCRNESRGNNSPDATIQVPLGNLLFRARRIADPVGFSSAAWIIRSIIRKSFCTRYTYRRASIRASLGATTLGQFRTITAYDCSTSVCSMFHRFETLGFEYSGKENELVRATLSCHLTWRRGEAPSEKII